MKKKKIFAAVLLMAIAIVLSGCASQDNPVCPNNYCEDGETSYTCPDDCGVTPPAATSTEISGNPMTPEALPPIDLTKDNPTAAAVESK